MHERAAPRRILSESEHHLLGHHPGTPDDHHHYLDAPLDREANELLSRGALDEVVSLAEIAPARVAEAMGRHRLVLKRNARHVSQEKLLLLTWDSLDAETRRQYLDGMIRLVLQMARSGVPYRERHDGPMAAVPYRFHSDELDVDATVEKWLGSAPGSPLSAIADYADLVVTERLPRRRAYVVMIDQSRSMRGSKAVSAALVSATLLLHLPAEDEWGVIAFAEKGQVIRAVGRRALHDDTVRELLEMRSEGCTDIAAGLEAGFAELARARMHDRIGILVTDGWLNTGPPPFSLVRQFTRLHVIELPGGDPALCARMAGAGRGTVSRVRSLQEIPRSVRRCLSAL
jgi:VWA domain-containing protein